MHTYDDHCELEWKNFWDNIDHYYFCHLGFWFIFGFLVRHRAILHCWSVLDEIIGNFYIINKSEKNCVFIKCYAIFFYKSNTNLHKKHYFSLIFYYILELSLQHIMPHFRECWSIFFIIILLNSLSSLRINLKF